jgi:hypothetical protein
MIAWYEFKLAQRSLASGQPKTRQHKHASSLNEPDLFTAIAPLRHSTTDLCYLDLIKLDTNASQLTLSCKLATRQSADRLILEIDNPTHHGQCAAPHR